MEEAFFTCPYCWQRVSILLERGEGVMEWIEDCEVCCNPILFHVEYRKGALITFRYERAQ
jgi:hypothetical protein